jgi:uncharacterized protein
LGLAILAEGGLIVLALALGRWLGAPAFGAFRWELTGLLWGTAATIPLLAGLRWCLRTAWEPMARLVAVVRERLGPFVAEATLAEIALVALLAGVGEEALFRGVAQAALGAWLPAWTAVLAASLLFGVAHWVTPLYAALATIVGVYLGALYLVSGNLLAPIVTHALYDLVALAVLARLKPASSASVV